MVVFLLAGLDGFKIVLQIGEGHVIDLVLIEAVLSCVDRLEGVFYILDFFSHLSDFLKSGLFDVSKLFV